ncbi:hypothetical protein V2J09_000763 [Rumex salicifolius]
MPSPSTFTLLFSFLSICLAHKNLSPLGPIDNATNLSPSFKFDRALLFDLALSLSFAISYFNQGVYQRLKSRSRSIEDSREEYSYFKGFRYLSCLIMSFAVDSDDDMHDANDVESLEDFYSGDTVDSDDVADGDYGFIDNDSDDSDDFTLRRHQVDAADVHCTEGYCSEGFHVQQSYTVLSEADIRQCQEDDITRISTVLSISRVEAGILLRYYNWSVSKVHDEWFADEEKVRKAVGLLESPVVNLSDAREFTCGICFETFPKDEIHGAVCGHPFCSSCWAGYISTSINDGPGCLALRCPDPSCDSAVGQDMIDVFVTDDDQRKYGRYFLRSYIEDNRKAKWCPAPGCDYAVDFVVGSGNYDVTCRCSYSFCWNCTEEAHRPVDCRTVSKWILKNSAESENMNWILANSKPCPKCKRPIEKNQGLCLGAWSDHGERTGGFYACNRYETAKQQGIYDDAEKRREMAKNSLERYTHYYERWATNQSSRQKAVADLQQMQSVHLEKLSDIQCQPESQLKFIIEAWSQIVECRRVLKWTYAYGYYLPEHEHGKRQFFEYLQGEAEAGLERLHQCAEKELQSYLNSESGPSKDFNEFRTKLAGLTSVTRNYFENLVRALENGLSDVDSHSTGNRTATGLKTMGGSASSSNRSRGGRGKSVAASKSSGPSKHVGDPDHWACDRCTYANAKSASACHMCNQRRFLKRVEFVKGDNPREGERSIADGDGEVGKEESRVVQLHKREGEFGEKKGLLGVNDKDRGEVRIR